MNFTLTEQRLLDALSDGMCHSREELKGQLYTNGYGAESTLHGHIHRLRKKLKPLGQDIVCQVLYHKFYYRRVRIFVPDEE